MKKEVRFKPYLFFGHVRSHEVPLALLVPCAKKTALKRAAVCVIGRGGSALCGHGHAFAEKQLVLGPGEGRSGLVSQVVHAAEELAIHHERKVAAHG